jgi:uncharacterized membrane protein
MFRTMLHSRKLAYVLAVAVLVLAAGGGYSLAASSSANTIKACANKHSGALRLAKGGKCKKGFKAVSWNKVGPAGANGANGAPGAPGAPGTNGASSIVVRHGATATNVGTTGTIIIAHCATGERATGGGTQSNSTNAVIVDSIPVTGNSSTFTPNGGTPDGWWLDVKTTSGTADITPIVVCASP